MEISIEKDIDMRMSERKSLNRLCDISDWHVQCDLTRIMKELNEGSYIHRKSWEYAMCIHGLHQLGVVKSDSRAIAIGAGYERPLYYFANNIKEMIATDLYEFPDNEGTPVMLTNPEKFAFFEYRKDHLIVKKMNAMELEYKDNQFDFCFSLSSIEHFGSRENTKQAVIEMHRVLKVGGVACIATELILNDATHHEYFTLDELYETVINVDGFELVGGDLDLRISRSLFENPIDLVIEKNLNISPHITLKQDDVVWTSVILFLQKKEPPKINFFKKLF